MSVVLAAACLSLTVPWAGAEVFSSTARLHALFEEADQVAAILGHYVRMEEARLRAISSLISEVQSMRNRTAGDGVKFVEHPLGAFHFIKKYAQIHTRMEAGTLHKDAVHDKLSGLSLAIPNNDDYEGSASAILRLQRIYNLPKKELMEGRVGGLVVEPLTLEDCNVIARKAHELSYFSQATEWYDVALRETDPSPYVTGEQRRRATLGLIDLYLQHNDLEHANSFANWGKTAYPDCEEIADAYTKVKEAESVAQSEDGELPPPAEEQPSDEQYAALCRGEVDWTNEYLSRGYCKLLTDSVPYRLVRQEVLSVDPFIALFHDVLSETEGAFFRQKAQENMQRAKVGNPGSQIVSETRVGQLTWLDDGTPAIKKISDRIMRITGLDVTMRQKFSSSESFQIVNYGIGGHYAPHLDVYENKTVLSDDGDLPSFLKGSGDRLATFLFYLDDVIEGGATVFPRVGVRVPVIKNGAAFWYNLHRTGENDIRTLHAGCPVLLGQKWVANKWIRERGQAFRHGCGLTPDTLHVET